MKALSFPLNLTYKESQNFLGLLVQNIGTHCRSISVKKSKPTLFLIICTKFQTFGTPNEGEIEETNFLGHPVPKQFLLQKSKIPLKMTLHAKFQVIILKNK